MGKDHHVGVQAQASQSYLDKDLGPKAELGHELALTYEEGRGVGDDELMPKVEAELSLTYYLGA